MQEFQGIPTEYILRCELAWLAMALRFRFYEYYARIDRKFAGNPRLEWIQFWSKSGLKLRIWSNSQREMSKRIRIERE